MSDVPLSVVVIGRNEADGLAHCLASVKGLDVLYVDSGSTDESREIAAAHGVPVAALDDPPFTAARGREAGWRQARGKWIFFLDGDCVLTPDALLVTEELRASPEVAVVWGVSRERRPGATFLQRVLELRYRGFPEGPGPLVGGNYFCRREALEAVDGFDETLTGGENANLGWRLRRAGRVVWHVEAPLVEFESGIDGLGAYWRRAIRFGQDEALHLLRSRNILSRLFDVGSAERLKDLTTLLVGVLVAATGWIPWWGVLAAVLGLKVWRSRRKGSPGMVLLYVIHTQIHCLPMFLGLFGYLIRAPLRKSY